MLYAHVTHGTIDAYGQPPTSVYDATTVPLTTAPSGFPGQPSQWGHLFTEVTVIPPAWSGASVAYKVGDLVTYSGVVYRCLQAHTSQAGWTPSQSGLLKTMIDWLKLKRLSNRSNRLLIN